MSVSPLPVKTPPGPADSEPPALTTAPLTNVALFSGLLAKLIDRPPHLPGIGCFYGYSGYGKTWSARYGANKRRAFYLECGESWTKLKFLRALLSELGVAPRGTAADLVDQAVIALTHANRPLIVDEADQIVRRGYIETVRELYDHSGVPIALLGEELLPQLIEQKSERTHNRILISQPAEPASVEDAAVLARLHHAGVEIAPDLLAAVVKASSGRLRRVVVNLYTIAAEAQVQGWQAVDLARWAGRPLHTGEAGRRRAG